MYGYYGYDTLFLAVIVVFILGIWAQIRVKNCLLYTSPSPRD